ncbi:hypothetical protein BS78_04G066100 [Paspalum vaginatum]|nr:hypothetical protein BS78_04G066100 [Paspalum vaginatum]
MGTYRIGSLEEFRDIVAGIGPGTGAELELDFLIEEDIPLDKAREIWQKVSQEGGEGTIVNPDVLVGKAEAWEFIQQKLRQLTRWGNHVERKPDELKGKLQDLQAVLDAGGPGLMKCFKAQSFDRAQTFLDSDQNIGDAAELETHIDMMKSLILEAAAGTGSHGREDEDGYYSARECEARQLASQEDATEFNFAFLKMKSDAVEALKEKIEVGVQDLATRFLSKPTNLGSSTADFVSFLDVPMYRGEMMGE